MENFGSIIKKARESKGWLIRHAAANLDIDQSLISKFENGDRRPTRAQVEKMARVYGLGLSELLAEWLSEKIVYDTQEEEIALQALKIAENKIKYNNNNKINYGNTK